MLIIILTITCLKPIITAIATVFCVKLRLVVVGESRMGFQSNLKLGPRCTVRQVLVIKQHKATRGKETTEKETRGGVCGLLALQFNNGVNSCEDLGENLVGSCFPCAGILVGWLISPLISFLPSPIENPIIPQREIERGKNKNQANTNPTSTSSSASTLSSSLPTLHLVSFPYWCCDGAKKSTTTTTTRSYDS